MHDRNDRIELLIEHLQAHFVETSVPDIAVDGASMFVFDSIGVALSGASHPDSAKLLDAVQGWGQGGDAHVWGSDIKLPTASAALVNAFHIHNQEFDCVHERAVVHPMAVILAALFAYAERQKNVSGRALLAAIAMAVDVATVIGMAATKPIRYFRPAQCGALGATAGMCVLAKFNRRQMRDAFGITYSQLAGTMQAHIEGTPTLALQIGFAARAAVCAVDLAALGFKGPHNVLDGKHGYFTLFEQEARPDPAIAELGNVWQITQVSHKPYPTGRAAHGGIAGLIYLMTLNKFTADDVHEIILAAPPLIRQLVDRPMLANDMSVSYARLCLPYLAAVTLTNKTVGLDAYSPELLSAPAIFQLASKIKITPDDNQNVNALAPQHLMVTLKDGRVLNHAMPDVYGAPFAPMTREAQVAKFIDCCRHAPTPLHDTTINNLIVQLDNLASLDDVSEIISLMIPTLT
ncbi:MAG: MmgE/PrpD family protein [Gammaproteobacteria bacterium]|nr:MmgE/PrpD family protein [Gammaproteobacteria bacterium]